MNVFEEFRRDDGFLDGVARFALFAKALAKSERLASEECYGLVPPSLYGRDLALPSQRRNRVRSQTASLDSKVAVTISN